METTFSVPTPSRLIVPRLPLHPQVQTDTTVDVVLVHGLTGSSAWEFQNSSAWGFQNFCELPKPRVLTWGYQTCAGSFGDETTRRADMLQEAQDMLEALALERKRSKRTTMPIIFVAHSLGGIVVKQALRLAHNGSFEKNDRCRSILEHTYGVIFVGASRRGALPKTLCLAAGQLASYTVLRNYERCHAALVGDCQIPSTVGNVSNQLPPHQPAWMLQLDDLVSPSRVKSWLPEQTFAPSLPFLKTLQSPPTTLFVLVALVYGSLAALQYHLNQADRFQRMCLMTGLAVGVWTTLPFFTNSEQQPGLVSVLLLSVTIAMLCSACGHWIWRTLFRTRKARLDRKIGEWILDASTMARGSHVIQFHEIT